jgi:VWFA-related protein
MKPRHLVFLLLVLAIVVRLVQVPLLAQEGVRVTVSVTSAGNTPVLDLLKGEFSVQDSGQAQTITTFVSPDTKRAAPPQLQPNEFSNVPDFRETSGAVFVVFDTIHTRYIDERNARQMVLKFLAKAAQAKHAVTLAILSDRGLKVYHDYRSGSDLLLAAMAKAGLGGIKDVAPPSGVSDAEVNAEVERLTAFSKGDQSNATPENQLLRSSVDLVLTMLQDVAFAASGLPGRKALVWVTNAVPFNIDPKTMQFKSLQTSSHGVELAGYGPAGGAVGEGSAVGVSSGGAVGRGSAVGGSTGGTVGGSRNQLTDAEIKRIAPLWRRSMRALLEGGVAIYPYEVRGAASAAANTLTQIAMKELALLTGGEAFIGSNDPFPEILTLSNGNTAGYVLGYSTDAPPSTDFRRTAVTASRANTEIAQPAGYFPYEGSSKSRAGEEIGLAMGSPLEYTAIRFKVTVAGIEEAAGGKKKVNLVISLPGDSGVLNEAAGTVDVGFVANAINASGQTVGTMNEGAGGKFPPDAVANIKEVGFQLKRSFEVAPGDATVRFLVRDNQSGRTGTIIFPLSVK